MPQFEEVERFSISFFHEEVFLFYVDQLIKLLEGGPQHLFDHFGHINFAMELYYFNILDLLILFLPLLSDFHQHLF